MRKRPSSSGLMFYSKFKKRRSFGSSPRDSRSSRRNFPRSFSPLGSHAKGNYAVASDLDILVVFRGQKRDDAYAVVKKVLGIPRLEPHLYT